MRWNCLFWLLFCFCVLHVLVFVVGGDLFGCDDWLVGLLLAVGWVVIMFALRDYFPWV